MLRMPGSSHRGPLAPLAESERGLARGIAPPRRSAGRRDRRAPRPVARSLARAADVPRRGAGRGRLPGPASDLRGRRPAVPQPRGGAARLEPGRRGRGGRRPLRHGRWAARGRRQRERHAPRCWSSPAASRTGPCRGPCASSRSSTRRSTSSSPRWEASSTPGQIRQRGDRVVTMVSLETIGYYSDEAGSQQYPPPLGLLYPSDRELPRVRRQRRVAGRGPGGARGLPPPRAVPLRGSGRPPILPGVSWSDHWAFWQAGYPALMVTDTAPYRYPWYHAPGDTPDRLDYDRLARVVAGLEAMLAELAAEELVGVIGRTGGRIANGWSSRSERGLRLRFRRGEIRGSFRDMEASFMEQALADSARAAPSGCQPGIRFRAQRGSPSGGSRSARSDRVTELFECAKGRAARERDCAGPGIDLDRAREELAGEAYARPRAPDSAAQRRPLGEAASGEEICEVGRGKSPGLRVADTVGRADPREDGIHVPGRDPRSTP